MDRISVVAKKPHRYAGVWRQTGEVYAATRRDAKVLKAVGLALEAPPPTSRKATRKAAFAEPLPPDTPPIESVDTSMSETDVDVSPLED